ncbi:hypothetical protein ACER0C_002989 [Sarotherodon galilaeus]
MRTSLSRSRALCEQPGQQEDSSKKDDRCHTRVINSLKREWLELQKTLELERMQRRERDVRESDSTSNSPNVLQHSHRLAADLESCKKELAATRQALDEACEERETLRVQLSTVETLSSAPENAKNKADHDLLRLDWVGSHYLAVTLPEDHMFKPGEPVTPAGVLHKLYEIRMGSRLATGFTVLLENINIMLSHTDPQWYAKHFGFRSGTLTHGNNYISADRIDVDEFAWLLFEYGAHAPLIEVLAGLQTVLSSTGKGGVTTMALCTGVSMYTSYVMLFHDTVSKAFERFERVRDRAADGVKHTDDPFKVSDSLSDFLRRKSRVNDQGKAGRVPTFTSQQALAYKSQ